MDLDPSTLVPFTFHILSGYRKKMAVNYGQSLEIGPGSIIGIISHFTTILAPNLMTLFFAASKCRRYPKTTEHCAERSILALSSAYQDIPGDI